MLVGTNIFMINVIATVFKLIPNQSFGMFYDYPFCLQTTILVMIISIKNRKNLTLDIYQTTEWRNLENPLCVLFILVSVD